MKEAGLTRAVRSGAGTRLESTLHVVPLLETIDDLEQMVGAHIAGLFHFSAHLSTDRVDRGWSCPTALVPTIASAMPIQYCLADHE